MRSIRDLFTVNNPDRLIQSSGAIYDITARFNKKIRVFYVLIQKVELGILSDIENEWISELGWKHEVSCRGDKQSNYPAEIE